MITIKRHPNLDNWLEIRFFSKVIDQVVGHARAMRLASSLAEQKGGEVYDLTCEKQQKKFDEMLDS